MRSDDDLLTLTVYQLVLLWAYFPIAATKCTDDQVVKCRDAVTSNKIGSLESGGQCVAKRYVQYTHLCSISDYQTTVDFCCCGYDEKVFCCRYLQDQYTFRCSEAEDSVDIAKGESFPLEILLAIILGPIAVLICCIICFVKCWCYKYDDEYELVYCCTKKADYKSDDKLSPQQSSTAKSFPREEQVPLTRNSLCSGDNSSMRSSCAYCSQKATRIEPSAPPLTEPICHNSSNFTSFISNADTCDNGHGVIRLGAEQYGTVLPYMNTVHCQCCNHMHPHGELANQVLDKPVCLSRVQCPSNHKLFSPTCPTHTLYQAPFLSNSNMSSNDNITSAYATMPVCPPPSYEACDERSGFSENSVN